MDLSKMPSADRVSLCKKYFIIGCLCLPFLWLVNTIWFFKYAFRATNDSEEGELESKQLKKWVMRSAIGSSVWIILLVAWNAYFQTKRTSLDWADSLTFILPVGRP